MIDKALTMYGAVDSGHVPDCYDGINIAEDLIAIIFIFVQLYFIFQNSKVDQSFQPQSHVSKLITHFIHI